MSLRIETEEELGARTKDGDNLSIERNPPDCPWCFANADDPEECR